MLRAGHARAAWIAASVAFALPRIASAQEEPSAEPVPNYGPRPPPPPPPPPPSRAPAPSPEPLPTDDPSDPAAPEAVPEPPPPRFGDAGEVVISADSSIGLSTTSYSETNARFVRVSFSPGFDYFVVRGFSLGLDVTVAYAYSRGYALDGAFGETTTTSLGAGPRFGFNLPLGDALSFYPRLTVGVESVHQERMDLAGSMFPSSSARSATLSGGYLVLFTPLLLHPTPHFFLGAGPGLFTELAATNTDPSFGGERTTWFGRIVVGGWWGGRDEPPASSAESPVVETLASMTPRRRGPRFGDAGSWVFSGDFAASITQTDYAGPGNDVRSRTSYDVSPGVDYFVAEHCSFGLSAGISRSSEVSSASTTSTELGASARVGGDFPLGSSLSLYARGSMGVGHTSYDAKVGLDQNTASTTSVAVALYTPLLVHFAPHAFAGFGPYVAHDLLNRREESHRDNLGTSVGARLIVGGWLSR